MSRGTTVPKTAPHLRTWLGEIGTILATAGPANSAAATRSDAHTAPSVTPSTKL